MNGDQISQEHVMLEFIDILHLLKILKYSELGLNQTDRECSDISYSNIQDIRRNMVFLH